MPFAAILELSSLDGTNGFQINGVAAEDRSGARVSAAGDINGDGIDDLVIGAAGADPNGNFSGATYVVFGRSAGFTANLNLSSLDGTNGFRVVGEAGGDSSGGSVTAAGDINHDGFDDLVIGASGADPNGNGSGATYVVFGRSTGFAANLNLSTLDGTTGFQINGETSDDSSGRAAASAGDINADGIDDLIIGAPGVDVRGNYSGSTYVLFGRSTGFAANLNLSTLDGTTGFQINGEAAIDASGSSISGAGDVNGDGIDDLIIGARGGDTNFNDSGSTYVVFGRSSAFAANLDLSSLDGTTGFRMVGEAAFDRSGGSVAAAGDVNGDGIADVIIGARGASPNGSLSGASYVVFGNNTGFAASLNLSALNGTNGFQISGELANDSSGYSVAGAGDLNGDGIDDLVIGANGADPNGSQSGSNYVVFGRSAGFAANLNLSALNGTTGFQINGELANDQIGRSVGAAGDVNGDGVDDLIVGALYADPNGSESGASYVIFGLADPMNFTGGGGDETASGGLGADDMAGGGGKDVLSGVGGNDTIDGGDANDLLYGGGGADDVLGGTGKDSLDGGDGDDVLDGGDDTDKLFGGTGADIMIGGLGNDRFEGGSEVDTLTGGEGNDHLDGGTGADVMTGGLGSDVYIVDNAGDQTIEAVGEGYDIVRTGLDWTLGADIEALEMQGAGGAMGIGNALANNLQGGGGNNRLDGLAGNDTINGGGGADIIVGGLGGDQLRGGMGADSFLVEHVFGPLEIDTIHDFDTADGDTVDLSGVDADAIAAGDQAFTIVSGFTKLAGQMTLTFAGGQTLVKLDTTGDGKYDYMLRINGDVTEDTGGWAL